MKNIYQNNIHKNIYGTLKKLFVFIEFINQYKSSIRKQKK